MIFEVDIDVVVAIGFIVAAGYVFAVGAGALIASFYDVAEQRNFAFGRQGHHQYFKWTFFIIFGRDIWILFAIIDFLSNGIHDLYNGVIDVFLLMNLIDFINRIVLPLAIDLGSTFILYILTFW